MKKLLLSLLAIGAIATAHAQDHSILVYGNAGYDRSTSDVYGSQTSNTSWNVNPGIGYQFNNHLTVGVTGGYSHENMANPYVVLSNGTATTESSTQSSWNLGAFFRYTQWLGNIFFVYGQINMGYLDNAASTQNIPFNSIPYYSETPATNGIQTQLFPGVGVNVYKGFALNFSFGGISYSSVSSKTVSVNGTTTSDHFNVTLGQQINIGVSKNINVRGHHHMHHEPGAELRRLDISDDDDDDMPPPPHHHMHKEKSKDHKDSKKNDDDDDE